MMISNALLKTLTFLLLLATIGMIALEVSKSFSLADAAALLQGPVKKMDASPAIEDGETLASEPVSTPEEEESADEAGQSSRLVVGALGAVPMASQIPAIGEVPWLDSQVIRAFDQANEQACRLLLPGVAVNPLMSRPVAGRRAVLGRMPAVTVGLEIDSSARASLPQASRGAIESYLRDHRLAIEPIVYQDEQGNAYLGTDCRAAFYPVAAPTTTIKAEPMIEEAIGRFRALGVLNENPPTDARTLVMAFRYVQSNKDRVVKSEKLEEVTELLFLHLRPGSNDKLPQLDVFATSDSRQNLHRLATQNAIIRQPLPIISAAVRFDSFVLMGLYPAKPVVTGVRHHATAVIGLDTILKLTKHADPADRITFQELLDQFSSITGETLARK